MQPAQTLYEINALVWLNEQPWRRPDAPDLAEIPEETLELWSRMGIDMVWFLGVWRRSEASRQISLKNRELYRLFPDLPPEEVRPHIVGSPFSIADYSLSPLLGDSTTLKRLREKLNARGIGLMLDFVPNHLAVDHPWAAAHPGRFVRGTEETLQSDPCNYFYSKGSPPTILAHGRDPYFAGWTDTVQVNVFSREMRGAMIDQLLGVAELCDGIRCDMAMLLNNEVFRNTWGDLFLLDYPDGPPPEFWREAISKVKDRRPDFLFLAEVYWNLERQLLEMGFDYTYDKTLYDRARDGDGAGIRAHLDGTRDYQDHMARFLENHDESRAMKTFGPRQRAVAAFFQTLPGLHLHHEGQFEGRRTHLPIQLDKRPGETPEPQTARYYQELLQVSREPVMRLGEFQLLAIRPAWEDNPSDRAIVACQRSLEGRRRLTAANIADHQAQAYIDLPLDGLDCQTVEMNDLLSDTVYRRTRKELAEKGLYLDLDPGELHIFEVRPAP